LVAEDDEFLRDVLKNVLEKEGYNVIPTTDGKSAKYILGIKPVDLVISDIQMAHRTDGIELLHWVKNEKRLPMILMTGFSEILETKEAYELGADEFFTKPFQQKELFEAINKCLEPKDKPPEKINLDQNFCKISIDDFVSGRTIPFTINIRLSKYKYVKIAQQGEDISVDRIKKYKSKDILHLYLMKEDFHKYVGLSMSLAKAVTRSKKISGDKKQKFLSKAAEVILENVYVNGVNQASFDSASTFLESSMSVLTDDENIVDLLSVLNEHSDHLYAHCLGVSTYALMIAKDKKWKSSQTLFKVALAGLFHDIGFKGLDKSIVRKPKNSLTNDELKVYRTHPEVGLEIISKLTSLPTDLGQIVYQHHEMCNGKGFPKGTGKQRIHPLARMISIADMFCKLVIKNPDSDGIPPLQAFHKMYEFHREEIDLEFLVSLIKVFNIDPETIVGG